MGEEERKADLQFESAEFPDAAKQSSCATCGTAIRDAYYEVDGQMACEACRYKAEAARTGGSAPGRFVKAVLFGGAAAALGAGLYYGVSALTGYEFGLIAIVVGLMVGGAVRAGSGRRGGLPYQLLAVFLTYTSIVSTYIPPIFEELAKRDEAADQTAAAAAAAAAPAAPGQAPAPAQASVEAKAPAAASAAVPAATAAVAPSLAGALIALALLAGLLFAAPFLMGFENIIGIVIIGIGLYEAWKINRKTPLVIGGPFRLGAAPAEPAAPAPPPIEP